MLNAYKLKTKHHLYVIALSLVAALWAGPVKALTAEDVMKKMTRVERSTFILGMIEGLMTARYHKDRPSTKGMNCIYNWKYGENSRANTQRIYDLFDKLPKKPAGSLLFLLIKKDCGT